MIKIKILYKFIAKHYIFISIFCFSIPLIWYSINYIFGKGFGMISYMSTSFAVNYFDYGFVKRGLIGTILSWIPGEKYVLIALNFSIFIFLVIIFVFSRLIEKVDDVNLADFLKVTLAISPFTSFQFGYEIGRLDSYNILLMISVLYFVQNQKWFLVLILSLCGLLLHESFATYALPLILSSIFTYRSEKFSFKKHTKFIYLVIYLLCSFFVAFLITKYGNSDLVVKRAPGDGQEAWARPLIQQGFLKLGLFNLTVTFSLIAVVYFFLFKFYQSNNSRPDLFFLAAFAPLSLFFLGWDFARWVGLIVITVITIVFIKGLFNKWRLTYQLLLYAGFVFLLPFGPIGFFGVFPMFRSALEFLSKIVKFTNF